MARSRSTKNTEMTENNEESTMSEMTNNTEMAEMTETESAPETSESLSVTDDSSETKAEAEPEVETFKIPANISELEFNEPTGMATMAGQRLLTLVKQISSIDELLKAQNEKDSPNAVIAFADSDEASPNVKAILAEYAKIEEQLKTALNQLTETVRAEKGDISLTPEQIKEQTDKRAAHVKNARTAQGFITSLVDDNPGEEGEKISAFLKAVKIPGTRAASSPGSGNYATTTNSRPRLGDNGYIEVNGVKLPNFTEAGKAVAKSTKTAVTTGQLHAAFANAGGVSDISDWQAIPFGEYTFTIGEGDKATPVKIVFTETTR